MTVRDLIITMLVVYVIFSRTEIHYIKKSINLLCKTDRINADYIDSVAKFSTDLAKIIESLCKLAHSHKNLEE